MEENSNKKSSNFFWTLTTFITKLLHIYVGVKWNGRVTELYNCGGYTMHDSPLEPRSKVLGKGRHYCNLPQNTILA